MNAIWKGFLPFVEAHFSLRYHMICCITFSFDGKKTLKNYNTKNVNRIDDWLFFYKYCLLNLKISMKIQNWKLGTTYLNVITNHVPFLALKYQMIYETYIIVSGTQSRINVTLHSTYSPMILSRCLHLFVWQEAAHGKNTTQMHQGSFPWEKRTSHRKLEQKNL